MDSRTPWTNLSSGRPVEPASSAPGAADPGVPSEYAVPSEYSRTSWWPERLHPVVVGLVLIVAAAMVLGVVVDHLTGAPASVSAPAASSAQASRQTSVRPTPVSAGVPSGHGFTMGTVVSNDGSTLRIHVLFLGSMTTVHADHSTRILIPMHTSVSGLTVGSNIVVYGTRYSDGSLAASLIVGGL